MRDDSPAPMGGEGGIVEADETCFDESRLYTAVGKEYGAHHTVVHSAGEYVRGTVHTNTIEGVFSIFKRGMKGVYQHCAEKHLHRYLTEFDFRASPWASPMRNVPSRPGRASRESVSPIGGLTKPLTRKQLARKFLRWRKSRRL